MDKKKLKAIKRNKINTKRRNMRRNNNLHCYDLLVDDKQIDFSNYEEHKKNWGVE